ncbi:MAG: hypothetical protein ACI9G1_001449 [Pirellulaceae bacterium]|jgi:hypothetical protein
MSAKWAARISLDNVAALASLREVVGIEAAVVAETVWLRGESRSEQLDSRLRSTPHLDRYELLADGQLIPSQRLVPDGWLPVTEWLPLAQLIVPKLPATKWPGEVSNRVTPKLVRDTQYQTPNLLVAAFERGCQFVTYAAEIRLEQWTFAACRDGRVVVRGTPVPAIQGEYFCESKGIAIPAGWKWSPTIDADQIRANLLGANYELSEGDLVLVSVDGSWERIDRDAFVAATRSALRLTLNALKGAVE